MTGLTTTIASVLAAGAVAASGLFGGASTDSPRTAVVVDAAVARDGRALVAPGLSDLDAELRLPRTTAEAETDLRYFAAQGYRLVVAGPHSKAAARAARLPTTALRG